MKNKKGLFVKKADYGSVINLLRKADIRYTSMNGVFHFDLISTIIGLAAGIAFGSLIF